MDVLLKNALRKNPSRIVVCEMRGEEARTLFIAINPGSNGTLTTIHANSAQESLGRLANPPIQMLSNIDPIIVMNKFHERR